MRVLVVDGSAEQAELLRDRLRKARDEITASLSSPLELLEAIEQHKADVIVIDTVTARAIIGAAVARLEELDGLRLRLAEAHARLAERKLVERAKGVLMKSRGLDEDAAYAALRKTAMDRKLRLAEVAQQIIDASDLLGA